jgi:ribosomal protein S18 acetylase RimI-like enzyme
LFATGALQSKGIPRMEALEDKPWGLREFALVDVDGNLLRIGQLIPTQPHAGTSTVPPGTPPGQHAAHRIHIQPLGAADVPQYRELMLHAYASAPDAFTSTPEERAKEPDAWWLKRIADPNGQSLALGAFLDGRLVGTAAVEFSVKPKTRHKAHLIGMFVHASCRGQGAGARLVQAALSVATARLEVRLVTLTVTEGNAAAVGLYERCGFRRFGVEPMSIATPAGYHSKIHMWFPLGVPDAN